MQLRWRILQYYRQFWPALLAALGLTLLQIGIDLLKPWPVAWIAGQVLPAMSIGHVEVSAFHETLTYALPQAILYAGVAVMVIYSLGAGLAFANDLLLISLGLQALFRLRTQLYDYLQRLPLLFHEARKSGDSIYRVAYDAQAIQTFLNKGFGTVINSTFMLISMFAVMFWMDPALAFLALSIVPFLWGAIYFFAERIRSQSKTYQEEESDLLARATESLSAIRMVQAFGQENRETQRFSQEAEESLFAHVALTRTTLLSILVVTLIMGSGSALILYFGSHAVLTGRLTVAELLVFLGYLAMLYRPLEQLSYTAWALEGATAGMQRVFEVLDTKDTIPESPQAYPLVHIEGRVALEKIQFGYDPQTPILHDISLEIPPGQTVGIVGESGAGKTTLLSLILRFYDPQKGCVRIDGHDICSLTKASLRSHISCVLQETLLLSGTIRDNIAYGQPEASFEAIVEAAQQAQAHEFIMSLPQKYSTEIGERGVRLSGGQRQRLGMARAFLKKAPLLLLDEPTSSLDLTTEAQLMESLKRLMQQQTTLIVTHRLPIVHHVDCLYVFQEGRIVESGKGPELLEQKGPYARLYSQVSKASSL